MVVLLMEDMRVSSTNTEPDFQLAEVSVTLREAGPAASADGSNVAWWADGEEVMKALQQTPSRLEGGCTRRVALYWV